MKTGDDIAITAKMNVIATRSFGIFLNLEAGKPMVIGCYRIVYCTLIVNLVGYLTPIYVTHVK